MLLYLQKSLMVSNILGASFFEFVVRVISSAKSREVNFSLLMLYPSKFLLIYVRTALMHIMKIVGDNGSPCLTPDLTENLGDIPCSVITSAEVLEYRDIIKSTASLSNPKYSIFSLIAQC